MHASGGHVGVTCEDPGEFCHLENQALLKESSSFDLLTALIETDKSFELSPAVTVRRLLRVRIYATQREETGAENSRRSTTQSGMFSGWPSIDGEWSRRPRAPAGDKARTPPLFR